MSRGRGVGGGGAAPNQSDQPAVNIERLKNIALSQYSPLDCYHLLVSRIPWMSNIIQSWRLSGATLLTFQPSSFVDALRLELPSLPFSVCAEIWDVIQEKVASDAVLAQSSRGAVTIDASIVQQWESAVKPSQLGLVQPINLSQSQFLSPARGSMQTPATGLARQQMPSFQKKYAFGPPLSAYNPFQNQSPAPLLSQNSLMVPHALLPPQSGPMAPPAIPGVFINSVNLQNAPLPPQSGPMANQSSAVAFNSQQQAQVAPLPSQSGQMAPPLQSPPNLSANVPPSAIVQQVYDPSQLAALPFSLLAPVKVLKPWEVALIQRGPDVQDPGLPTGYKRINMAETIQAAKAERLAQGAIQTVLSQVTWPIMTDFDAKSFHSTRAKYYEAVIASTDSALFRTFKSTLSSEARNAAYNHFHLTNKRFIELPDETFLSWCAQLFGPANKREAIAQLKTTKLNHRDAVDSQATFVNKFDSMCYIHELNINDIADAQAYWPQDPANIETATPFTEKEISTIWIDLFPKQTTSTFSVQLKKCREFLEQHKETPFNVQVQMLRTFFSAKDRAVAKDGDVYSTMPTVSSKAYKASSSYSSSQASSAVSSKPFEPSKRSRDDKPPVRSERKAVSDKPQGKQVIPGHKRGTACGSWNNHFGLGCTPTSCVFFGTSHQKGNGKNHVWKSSTEEESIRVDDATYKKLVAARPQVIDNWKKAAKQMKQTKLKAGVAALEACDDDDADSDFNQDDADDPNCCVDNPSDSADDNASDDNKAPLYSSLHLAALSASADHLSPLVTRVEFESAFAFLLSAVPGSGL